MSRYAPTKPEERRQWQQDVASGTGASPTATERLLADVERLSSQVEAGREAAASLDETHRLLNHKEVGAVFLSAHVHGVRLSKELGDKACAVAKRREAAIAGAIAAGLMEATDAQT